MLPKCVWLSKLVPSGGPQVLLSIPGQRSAKVLQQESFHCLLRCDDLPDQHQLVCSS
jgi:hypothetical protein